MWISLTLSVCSNESDATRHHVQQRWLCRQVIGGVAAVKVLAGSLSFEKDQTVWLRLSPIHHLTSVTQQQSNPSQLSIAFISIYTSIKSIIFNKHQRCRTIASSCRESAIWLGRSIATKTNKLGLCQHHPKDPDTNLMGAPIPLTIGDEEDIQHEATPEPRCLFTAIAHWY